MEITTVQIKDLRDATGVSIMQCKKALEEAEGDVEKAQLLLRKQSSKIAGKKAGRTLGSGTVASYIHAGGTVGSMVELLCETDFVAKNEEFQTIARDIAMQIAATSPEFVNPDDIKEEDQMKVKELFTEEAEGKPAEIKEKIIQGKLDAYFAEKTLLLQPFIKDGNRTISNLLEEGTQKFGERMEIGRIERFSILD